MTSAPGVSFAFALSPRPGGLSGAMGDYALAVRVEEGRHFPRDEATVFRVAAAFDDEPQSTPFASPSAAPFGGTTLAWEVPTDRLKRVQSTGTGQLKLTGACARQQSTVCCV